MKANGAQDPGRVWGGAVSWLSRGRSCLEAKAEEWCCGQSGRGIGGLRVPL